MSIVSHSGLLRRPPRGVGPAMSFFRCGGRVSLGLVLASFPAVVSASAPPTIHTVIPRGAQRGAEVGITLIGARLEGPLDVLCDDPGMTCIALEAVDGATTRATLRLAPDCRLGLHFVRLRTVAGISNGRLFSVGALPEILEAEPNNVSGAAQAIVPPVCVNGVIPPEDVDVFSFAGSAGQRVAIEIEGQRLGDTLFDPRLALLDAGGVELASADDSSLLRQDSSLVFILPADGSYGVQVRETAYGGASNAYYRLHIGAFPRPTAAHPCGGQAGTTTTVTWLGSAESASQPVSLPSEPGVAQITPSDAHGISPSPVPFRVVDFAASVESEPNDVAEQGNAMAVPGGVSGVFATARDVDHYVFEGVQGQTLEARVFGRRLGAAVDPVIHVRRLSGGEDAVNDDAAGVDSVLRWTCQASDKYVIAVRDLLYRGDSGLTYFLEVTPPRPALSLTVSSVEAGLTVAAGNRAALLVTANRVDFGGALDLTVSGLPAGVSVQTAPMAANVGQVPLVFEAAGEASPAGALVDLSASHADASTGIRGSLRQPIELVRYENNPFYTFTVDRLAVAVAKPAPIRVELVERDVPIVRYGSMSLPVRIERVPGFTGHVTVRMLWNPPGIASGALELPPDVTEGGLPLNAAGNAAVGRWPVAVVATTDGGGAPIEVSSRLCSLSIADPFVEFAVEKARTEQGQPVEVVIKLTQRAAFEGEAQLQLLGLPHKVSAAPVTITRDTQEVRFPVTVEAEAPPGEHGGLFVHARIPFAEAIIPHNSPAGVLIIDRPLPPKDPQKEAERAEAARKAQEEKERKKAERLAALEARRREAEGRKSDEPPPPQP